LLKINGSSNHSLGGWAFFFVGFSSNQNCSSHCSRDLQGAIDQLPKLIKGNAAWAFSNLGAGKLNGRLPV